MTKEKPSLEFKGHSLREIGKIMKCSKTQVARELKEAEKKVKNKDKEFLEALAGVLNELAKKRMGQQIEANGTELGHSGTAV